MEQTLCAVQKIQLCLDLRKKYQIFFLFKCICHSFNLCASSASEKLPSALEEFTRNVYNYFSFSPKRVEYLKDFQNFTLTPEHKILHPAQTRWLSLESVVVRILEQYNALTLFFVDAVANDHSQSAENILSKLQDPLTKNFLWFLQFALPFFNKLNREMQSEKPKIHELHSHITATYKTILECFIKKDIILKTPLHEINYKDPKNYLPFSEIYLGAQIAANSNLNENQTYILKTRCLDFL